LIKRLFAMLVVLEFQIIICAIYVNRLCSLKEKL